MKKKQKLCLFDILGCLIFGIIVLICVYPFYYIFIYSISDPSEVVKGIFLFPAGLSFSNYKDVFEIAGLFSAFGVSVLRTVLGTALTVFSCALYAYLVTKKELPFRKFFYRLAVITMYLNAGLIPVYLTLKTYGLRNSFLVYILPAMLSAYYIILIKTFMEQLPPALEESARIDGAGHFAVFFKIILPLSKPILATIAVFAAVGQWNSWFDNYLYCTDETLKTLQYLLYNVLNDAQNKANAMAMASANTVSAMQQASTNQISAEGVRMTITMIATLPILCIYPFMQKYFVKGITLGAVKG